MRMLDGGVAPTTWFALSPHRSLSPDRGFFSFLRSPSSHSRGVRSPWSAHPLPALATSFFFLRGERDSIPAGACDSGCAATLRTHLSCTCVSSRRSHLRRRLRWGRHVGGQSTNRPLGYAGYDQSDGARSRLYPGTPTLVQSLIDFNPSSLNGVTKAILYKSTITLPFPPVPLRSSRSISVKFVHNRLADVSPPPSFASKIASILLSSDAPQFVVTSLSLFVLRVTFRPFCSKMLLCRRLIHTSAFKI